MRKRWISSIATIAAVVFCVAGSAVAQQFGQPGCRLEMEALAGAIGDSTAQGYSHICADDTGVQVQIIGSNLAVGDVYTAWFVYIDQPSSCKSQPCTPADLTSDDPAAIIARLDGVVVKNGGWAYFTGRIKDLKLSSGSLVWVALFGHGPASTGDNKKLARQLLTPQVPGLGAPGLGTAGDGALGRNRLLAAFPIP